MALTPSNMLPLGTSAPNFKLADTVSGKTFERKHFEGRPLLVMFICNHCPFVVHLEQGLSALGRDYRSEMAQEKFSIVAISSNDVGKYPADGPEKMKAKAMQAAYAFPYLLDESQQVAKDFDAACTPDFFLFDASHKLVYRGQFDDSRPGNGKDVTGRDLRQAIDSVIAGQKVPEIQRPSVGCSIKWR